MDISKYDRNFAVQYNLPENLVWRDATEAPISVHGVYREADGSLHRLPADAVERIGNTGYAHFEKFTAGGRLRFRTDSKVVAFRVELTDDVLMPDMPLTGSSGCDVYVGDTEQRFKTFLFTRKSEQRVYVGSIEPNGTETITVYLPLYNGIRSIAVGILPNSSIFEPAPYAIAQPIVFYGSSITQGACASRTSLTNSALLSRWLNADFVNLGFSGSAKGEVEMAEYIASLNPCMCVLEYDANAPDAAHLRKTYRPFFDTLRQQHKTMPIVGMSCWYFKHFPQESAERREIIREVYDNARAMGDENAYFVDGETFFGDTTWEACLTGKIHPNDIGFMRVAEGLLPVLQTALRKG